MHTTPHRTPLQRASMRRIAGSSRIAMAAISLAVVGTSVAFAIPRFFAPPDDTAAEGLVVPAAAPVAGQPAANGQAPAVGPAVGPTAGPAVGGALAAPAAAPAAVKTSADGDLVVELALRWPSAVSGTSVPATVRLVNTSLKAFQLPSAGEPHPTLAVVVLDREGNEVRRVVESGPDPYPRRTTLVASGASMELPTLVVGATDAALAPGEYTVHAELRADPVWARLGLPMWKAPYGPARSLQMPLSITAKPE